MDTAISTLKRGGKLPLPPFQPPIQPDMLRSIGPIRRRPSVRTPIKTIEASEAINAIEPPTTDRPRIGFKFRMINTSKNC
ncbi:uncharacterized protein MELLADRAFT_54974 [Melampsora larici-populina 98AG31]|uniref:Uncharacterized protein n=1 Tax=Melampsora larici-populina (strain 98AG31 / pathotype 3-4-7) TaxID=747676 RepID=F4R9A2_MELLP|nr:uncharacterized protein MELLADRAFT_54974 [Melampsora larici-populina 98AG31]EGG11191.1 hypothetical protein MELLADRAFT_54974 [Melampsora larici-populina 98AG31]